MAMLFPNFKYHPDPLATGAVEVSETTCECCGKARGHVYAAAVYAIEELQSVCPWCIADGSLERQYDATLSDEQSLRSEGLSSAVIHEVTRGLAALSTESGFTIEDLREIVKYYEPRGSPAFYKFVCRHCSRVKYDGDCD